MENNEYTRVLRDWDRANRMVENQPTEEVAIQQLKDGRALQVSRRDELDALLTPYEEANNITRE